MIDTGHFAYIEMCGYETKEEAYEVINKLYSNLDGVTTYYDDGLWYIVQAKALK
jgi:hypothetical protein